MKRRVRQAGRSRWEFGLLIVAAVMMAAGAAGESAAQWVVKSEDGNSTLNLGFLLQGRAEWAKTQDVDPVVQNTYLRRARVLLGGKINAKTAFFLDWDSPNFGLGTAGNTKSYDDMRVLDFFGTYTLRPEVVFDAGLLLTPGAYNHMQSAAALLPLDYGPYTFREAGPMITQTGRDPGVQMRGLLGEKLVEYRLGAFQGVRDSSRANPFRFAARVALHPLRTASPGYFYTGSTLTKSRALSIGAAVDLQEEFKAVHGDIFLEQPFEGGSSVTVQADFTQSDGGDFLPSVQKQTTMLVEAGYTIANGRYGAFAQAAQLDFDADNLRDEMQVQGGFVLRLDGNRQTLKAAVTQITSDDPEGAPETPDRTGVSLQYQLFYY